MLRDLVKAIDQVHWVNLGQNLMKSMNSLIVRESLPEVTHSLPLPCSWSRGRAVASGLLKIAGLYINRRWGRGHSPMW